MGLLSLMIFVPLFGMAIVLCLPSRAHGAIRWTAVAATVPPLLYSVRLLAAFDPNAPGYQFVERVSWIPPFGIEYFVGIDGLSITMVLLTTLLLAGCGALDQRTGEGEAKRIRSVGRAAEARVLVSRLDIPQVQPGAILPVAIDPLDPKKVALAIYRDKQSSAMLSGI